MPASKLRKVGGSVMVSVPPTILTDLGLEAGATVDVAMEAGRILITPRRPRYTLEELLAQCDGSSAPSDEDRQWVASKAQGDELI